MAIQILVVHEYTVIQKIAQNYILTEYTDATVKTFSATLDAIEELKHKKYNIIFCAMEMPGLDGIAFSEAILDTMNKDTHFVIMTSNYGGDKIEAYKQLGINNVLSIPFTQPQLTALIQGLFDPRASRVFERFVVKDSAVVIPLADIELKAQLINIGLNGLLCELKLQKPDIQILTSSNLSIKFPDPFGYATQVQSCLMRMTVIKWDKNHFPKVLRLAYRFIDMSEVSKKTIQKAVSTSAKELTLAEAEALERILEAES